MSELEKQVRRAYRRLGFQRFLRVLGWCWFGTLLAALGAMGVDKFYPLGVPAGGWAAGALGLGLVVAVVWMLATRRGPLGAAIEIDRRFGLKERVSSTLAMAAEERETEAGQALLHDAIRRVGRIDVASRFAVTPGKQVLLPLLPGLLAVLVSLIPPMAENPAEAKADALKAKQQVEQSAKKLREKLAERQKKAQEKGLKDAEELFKKLEQGTRDMAKGQTERKKALATLNDLSRQLQQRRSELGTDKIKQELDQLKNIDRGPADKFAKAVREGDFKKAAEELGAIKKELAGSNLDEKQKQQLAGQLEQVQEKLKNLAQANQAAQKDLQNRIGQLRQAGQLAEASKLEEQLSKLLQQGPQMKQLDEVANKLGQCAQCLRDGQLDAAADALGQLQANLQQQLGEMEMLNEAMEQLRQARNQMNCPQCGGAGCEACQGPPGMGMGAGRGQGPRPEAEDETAMYESQVRQKPGEGAAVITELVEGPNVKGDAKEEIRQEYDAARRATTDPLTNRNIPRKHQAHVKEYFNRFREGE
jgi:hypothetical protein